LRLARKELVVPRYRSPHNGVRVSLHLCVPTALVPHHTSDCCFHRWPYGRPRRRVLTQAIASRLSISGRVVTECQAANHSEPSPRLAKRSHTTHSRVDLSLETPSSGTHNQRKDELTCGHRSDASYGAACAREVLGRCRPPGSAVLGSAPA
jgi:hypothetical protein